MRRFHVPVKRFFLFAIIFMLLAGNVCSAEEITLTTIMPTPKTRMIYGSIVSGLNGASVDGYGCTASEAGGQYYVAFTEPFPAGSIVSAVCIYYAMARWPESLQSHRHRAF